MKQYTEKDRDDNQRGNDVHMVMVDVVSGENEVRHKVIDVEAVVGVGNHRTEWAERSSECSEPCMRLAEEGMHLAVAFHGAKVVVEYVPFVIVEDDSPLDHLEDGEDIGLQEDCHLNLQDLGVPTNRGLTSIDLTVVL